MPRIFKRPPIQKGWHRLAECRWYDDEMFDPEHPLADTAQTICLELCTVATSCLRSIYREEAAEGNHVTSGVIRGGRFFTGAARSKCNVCGYAAATGKSGVCAACKDYQTCALRCGRMVRRESGRTVCLYCVCTGKEAA